MSLTNILVYVDESKNFAARLDVAMTLARAHEAHLTGLYVMSQPYVPTYMVAQVGAEMLEFQEKLAREAAETAAPRFRKATEDAGLPAEWRVAEGYPPDAIIAQARYADLVVLSQMEPGEADAIGAIELPTEVVLGAGRPVLVVPYAGKFKTTGERVLVAWNASREATRALHDAMPILVRAKTVAVVNVNPAAKGESEGDLPGADISLHLARHGVKVEAAPSYASDIDVGDVLLSRAADMSADLIVMGAYGRSRLRELVMGGASRHILKHLTAPVLMSH